MVMVRRAIRNGDTTRCQLIRTPLTRLQPVPTVLSAVAAYAIASPTIGRAWTPEEHERSLEGLEVFLTDL